MLKVSAVKGDAHVGEGASNGKCETGEPYRTTVGFFAPAGVEIDLVRINPRVLPGVRIVAIDLELFTRVASAGACRVFPRSMRDSLDTLKFLGTGNRFSTVTLGS